MADPTAKPRSAEPGTSGDTEARLELRLADRERQLGELTEHCLQILDELARSRQELRQRDALQARIEQLEATLADARSRVRLAGSVVLAGVDPAAPPAFEVVVFGATEVRADALQELLAAAGEAPVTVLVAPGAPLDDGWRPSPRLRVLVADGPAIAQQLNLALACTQAEVVVCLRAGIAAAAEDLAGLAEVAAAEGVALVCPVLQQGRRRWLGLQESQPLRLEPRKVRDGKAATVLLDFADPRALVLRRRVAMRLGPFDQDLQTDLAVAEWCLRARAADSRVVGAAEIVLRVPEAGEAVEAASQSATDGDRLLTLARHRPALLASAAVDMESFWHQSPEVIGDRLRGALRRLPSAESGEGVELLVQQAQAMARNTVPVPVLRAQLQRLEQVLEATLDLGSGHYTEQLQRAVDRVHTAVRSEDQAVRSTLERLQHEVAAERDAKRHLEELLTARDRAAEAMQRDVAAQQEAVRSLQEAVRSLKDEIIARDGLLRAQRDECAARDAQLLAHKDEIIARDAALRSQLEELRSQREELRSQHEEREREVRDRQRLQHQVEQLGRETEQLRRHADEADAARRSAVQTGEDLRLRNGELAASLRDCERVVEDLRRQLAAAEQRVALAEERVQAGERQLEGADGRIERLNHELEAFATGQAALRNEHGSLREHCIALDARVHALMTQLQEREQWIKVLLQESTRRRLFRRELDRHEAEFLKKLDERASQGR